MKKTALVKSRVIVSLLTFCILLIFSITAYAANPVEPKTYFDYSCTDYQAAIRRAPYRTSTAFFMDEAGIISVTSEREIWNRIKQTADELGIQIGVFIGGNYRTDIETEDFAHNCSKAVFGSVPDSLFIYLDFEGESPSFSGYMSSYDYIRVFNRAEDIFPQSKRNNILDAMYKYLPKSSEPIYEDKVRKGIINGLDEIERIGTYKTNNYTQNSYLNNDYPNNYNNTYDSSTNEFENIFGFLKTIPAYLWIGGIFLILIILSIISSASNSARRRANRNGYDNYYNNSRNYYDDDRRYYNRHSSYHHSSSRNRSYSSRSTHSSSRPSSGSGSNSSSGTGRHR